MNKAFVTADYTGEMKELRVIIHLRRSKYQRRVVVSEEDAMTIIDAWPEYTRGRRHAETRMKDTEDPVTHKVHRSDDGWWSLQEV